MNVGDDGTGGSWEGDGDGGASLSLDGILGGGVNSVDLMRFVYFRGSSRKVYRGVVYSGNRMRSSVCYPCDAPRVYTAEEKAVLLQQC